MFIEPPTLYLVVYLLVLAGVVLIAGVLVRLMLAATAELNAITCERELRLELLLLDDEPGAPGDAN